MDKSRLRFIMDVLTQNVLTFNELKMQEARDKNSDALDMILQDLLKEG